MRKNPKNIKHKKKLLHEEALGMFYDMPITVTNHIFANLSASDLRNVALVSRGFLRALLYYPHHVLQNEPGRQLRTLKLWKNDTEIKDLILNPQLQNHKLSTLKVIGYFSHLEKTHSQLEKVLEDESREFGHGASMRKAKYNMLLAGTIFFSGLVAAEFLENEKWFFAGMIIGMSLFTYFLIKYANLEFEYHRLRRTYSSTLFGSSNLIRSHHLFANTDNSAESIYKMV